ncbi:thioredoxin [Streptococcus pneumoniae]|nr:thioredoxin [Streptococcus pneumoniae]
MTRDLSQQTLLFSFVLLYSKIPARTLQSMDGKEVKLSDFKGKKVYLKFWASWCGPCKKSMPELMELAAKPPIFFSSII